MTDLAEWLQQQIDEDERLARRSGDLHYWAPPDAPEGTIHESGGTVFNVDLVNRRHHIAEHDPARVLRQVTAYRWIVDLHDGEHECIEDMDGYHTQPVSGSVVRNGVRLDGCQTLRLLATIYSHREGHRQEWQP